MSPAQNKIAHLYDRAVMLKRARGYLEGLGCCEVDVPHITRAASVDAHIDLIGVEGGRYLHSSPEYGMKRLLCLGMGDLFQLAHVFRRGESSSRHNPEFMMAEWYRLGISFEQHIAETLAFIRLFLGELPHEICTYRALFTRHAGVDPFTASELQLHKALEGRGIAPYPGIEQEGRDGWLNLLWGALVEPALDPDGEKLIVVSEYPASQAALARKGYSSLSGGEVAYRFEVYYRAVELANGYHELCDAVEQRQRLYESNLLRRALGKDSLPVDDAFLQALENEGLPDCCGVAVGFDRLMLLRLRLASLDELLPFPWAEA